jgi:hypothetical protein
MNDLTFEEYLYYELASSWEKRLFEDEEKLRELGMID